MSRRLSVHRIGLTASAAGVAALIALPFGAVARLRVVDGDPVSMAVALGLPATATLLALWLLLFGLSFVGPHSRRWAFARGVTAAASIVALVWLSGSAATRLLSQEASRARYAMGGGVWLAAFAAFTVVLASRREAGEGSPASLTVVALAPLGIIAAIASGHLSRLGIVVEYRNVSADMVVWTGQHIAYSAIAVAIAILAGVALGVLAHRTQRIADVVFTATSVFQTIPGLAMIGILAVPLGMFAESVPAARALGIGVLGWAPVIVALTLYALLAIVRNTYAGLNSVPASTVEAARGMGLSSRQVLRKVQLPLSAPIVFSGIRTAAQQTIGNATLGVFVAAGTLGRPIFGGVSQTANDLVLLGSITLVTLALITDIVMRGLERLLTPRRSKGAR